MKTSRPLIILFAAFTLLVSSCHASNSAPQTSEQSSPATPAVQTRIGFTSTQRLHEHYEKHGSEFGGITETEYLRQAQTLRDSPAGGSILEISRADGVTTRFDRSSGAFLAFNRDLTIRTFFKPNDGERYFVRQAKR